MGRNKIRLIILIFFIPISSWCQEAKVQIQFSPVATILGASNIEVNYGFNENFSLGFGGLWWESELLGVDFRANEFHGNVIYWKNGNFTDSWFGLLGYSQLAMKLSTKDSTGKKFSGELTGRGPIVGSGYNWQWDNLNIQTGYSFGFYGFKSEVELESSDGEIRNENVPMGTVGSLFLNLGWLF